MSASLIAKGMIHMLGYGETAFIVRIPSAFMRKAKPGAENVIALR